MKRQATKPTAQKSQEPSQESILEAQSLESTKESDQAEPQNADSSADSSGDSMDRHATASAVSRDDRETPSLRGSEATEAKQGEAEASLVIHKNADSTEQAQEATPSTQQDSSAAQSTQTETPKESLDSKIAEGESGAFSRNIGLRRAVSLVLQGEQGDKTSGLLKDFSSKTKSPYNLICVIISWHTYARVVIPRIRANEITTPYRIHFTKLDSRFVLWIATRAIHLQVRE